MRQQKSLALRNRNLLNGSLLIGIAVGIASAALWAMGFPLHGPSLLARMGMGLLGGLALGMYLQNRVSSKSDLAKCPTCNYSWEIAEGERVPTHTQLPNWDKCPGCGLLMNEVLLRRKMSDDKEPL